LEEVKEEVLQDKNYKVAMKSQEQNEENSHNILSQGVGVLYHGGILLVPCSIGSGVVECEYESKVADHIGEDKTKDLVRRNLW
jgi:hypothetical protein